MIQAKVEQQEGKCAICSMYKGSKLEIDHDHVTGAWRGMLCKGCNTGLGKLGDTEASLLRAVQYLRGQ